MKRVALLIVVLAATFAVGQATPAEQKTNAPNYSDMYCAGFLSKENYNPSNYLVAGAESPIQSQFGQGDTVFLAGSGYAVGQRYSIIRELRDPNHSPAFLGQQAALASAGNPYQELGYVTVTGIRGSTAIAKVQLSCTAMVAGDIVVPFVEKQPVEFHPTQFQRFPAQTSSVTGQIVMAKDFDVIVGNGGKVYLNVGSSKGVKIGDYFIAVRGYDPATMGEVEALSYRAKNTEDTQYKPHKTPNSEYSKLPVRAVAEMVVLSVTPTSSTAMITHIIEHVNVGDMVEMEGSSQQ